MKESKKFFENNRLNKGYGRAPSNRVSDSALVNKKYNHALPPIDMMEEYEEMNPGSCAQLFSMAKQEQNHRHSMDLVAMNRHNKAVHMGRMFSLLFVMIVAASTFALAFFGNVIVASVFAGSAFACIVMVSYFYSKNTVNTVKREFNRPQQRNHRPSKGRGQRNNRPSR
ncbi:MAG: hypothetical protein COA94_06855 [Rickettsiales bacterium]|nr:MAG: hypothetical protein COA94_06855 [Rickettsiales bacterium]